MVITKQQLTSLELFKRLIKDGCIWAGDVVSHKWSECLYIPSSDPDIGRKVSKTLESYEEGIDYTMGVASYSVWIV